MPVSYTHLDVYKRQTHFTLNGTSGNGTYVGGTGTCSGGGMAYYDAYTAQAALTALGRSLAAFYTQDDDPTVNGSADTNFLASLIKSHIDAIRTAVLAAYSGAKFELLWPHDVNFTTCLLYTSPARLRPPRMRRFAQQRLGLGLHGQRRLQRSG